MADDAAPDPDAPTGRPCPQCGKPAVMRYRPFCSKRCADLDLSRWLNGVYAIPASEADEDDEDADTER
ncbi:DNA gyrase inhibitor YacG [Alsobacter sp. SYSU M60028]|uniref:DNA gyrase inhibitor YacG n=1 Tax=Alsobacter ponti TaxID=2962936 RepID=A0ABT1LF74_9HYPH|nr:DNA gyrase inhibitor YacG [Alsobacter ponti]MCP8940074.1 DNA gyrase inhibitor YacG [Alsobacter ponti]